MKQLAMMLAVIGTGMGTGLLSVDSRAHVLTTSQGQADARTQTADSDKKQINFIGVQFQHGISGNVLPQHQQLVFQDQVRTIVGPVPTWDAADLKKEGHL